jgi:PTH2 family peptidyl-tRNA hydrolase
MYKENAPKQVIIIRKDLNMRKGKMIAQGAHASMKVIFDMMTTVYNPITTDRVLKLIPNSFIEQWVNGIFKKIVVGADSLNELVDAYNQAKTAGIPCSIIEDAGLTEFGGNVTITAVAIGPDDPEKIDKITGKFNLL